MSQSFANPIRVLVLHPEAIVSFGLVAALAAHADLQVSAGQPIEGPQRHAEADVIVCEHDIGLGLAKAADRRLAAGQRPRLLIVGAPHLQQGVHLALAAGVHGCMLQGCPVEELVQGVRSVALGQRFMSAAVAQNLSICLNRAVLTGRESEVLVLLGRGYCNKSIGRELGIALGTVKTHVKAIFFKLDARSRTQAVSVALQRGLVGPGTAARHHLPLLDAQRPAAMGQGLQV
jgi:DNA-binding NarL/FixJ family response regulator